MGFTTSRKTAAAALAGAVLVGGGIAAVAPAAAEDSAQFAATNWKKVWKNDLQQYADKRYYTKKKSDKKYATKTTLDSYYTKAQTDATYATKTQSYTKAESDAKYAPYPKTIRGIYIGSGTASAAGQFAFTSMTFGYTLAAAPTLVFKPLGGPANPNCTGTAAAPQAAAGFLCIYEGAAANYDDPTFANAAGAIGVASPTGVILRITSVAAGTYASLGGWAVTPAAPVATTIKPDGAAPGKLLGN